MGIRIVYILDNKTPDVIDGAESWSFNGGTLKIWSKPGAANPMIEIMDAYVLSVEHFDREEAAEEPKCESEGPVNDQNEPIENVETS